MAATREGASAGRTGGLHVPIIGTHGVGKTSFIVSLGQVVSARGWGEVVDGFNFYSEKLAHAMDLQSRPLPATPPGPPVRIRLRIDRIPHEGAMVPANLSISTGDISGGQFEDAMTLITKQPALDSASEASPLAPLFDVLKRADGLVVILDITRYLKGPSLEESIMKSIADQIRPLCNAIDMVADSGSKGGLRTVYFVFNKQDIHKRTVAELKPIAENVFAILLRRLRTKSIQVDWKACSSLGWSSDDVPADRRLEGNGIDRILTDLVAALGIVTPGIGQGGWDRGQVSGGSKPPQPIPSRIKIDRPKFRGWPKYYRTLAEAILSNWGSWSSETGDEIQLAEIWIRLRKSFICDIQPNDVQAALKIISKDRLDGTPDPVVIRGQKVRILVAGGGSDEMRMTEEIKKAGGSLPLDVLPSFVLAKEGWSRERMMGALQGLERKGVIDFKDGAWRLIDSGPSDNLGC